MKKSMKRIQEVFRDIEMRTPALGLRSKIFECIEKEQKTLFLRRRHISLVGLILSVFIFLVGIFQYGGPLLQSDFWSFCSLLFSDVGLVVFSLQDFVYSLLETLPVVPLFALLIPLALFFWSVASFLSLSEHRQTTSFSHSILAH